MKFYWTIDNIPELAVLPKEERGKIWRRYFTKGFRHWQTWAGWLLCSLFGGLWTALLIIISESSSPYKYPFFILPFVLASITGGIAASIHTEQIRPYLREYLKEIDDKHDG
jgi:hypothetical protein